MTECSRLTPISISSWFSLLWMAVKPPISPNCGGEEKNRGMITSHLERSLSHYSLGNSFLCVVPLVRKFRSERRSSHDPAALERRGLRAKIGSFVVRKLEPPAIWSVTQSLILLCYFSLSCTTVRYRPKTAHKGVFLFSNVNVLDGVASFI